MNQSIESLLPNSLVCAEQPVIDYSSLADLKDYISAQELSLVGRTPVKRFNEFITGRICCKQCLAQLDVLDFPVLQDKFGLPVFPNHIVGSISHTKSDGIAILGKKSDILGVGIDIEEIGRIKENHLPIICTMEELDFLHQLNNLEQQLFSTLIFSAKEAFYKLAFSISTKEFNFKDLNISVTGTNSFAARLFKDLNKAYPAESELTGLHLISGTNLITVLQINA